MSVRGQPWYNRLWMTAVNSMVPGRMFDTGKSGPVSSAYAMGDYKQAQLGDPWAKARIAAGAMPGLLGLGGEFVVDRLQNRAINQYENSPDFIGPPRNYDSGGSGNESPYTYSYANPASVGPPAPDQLGNNAPMPSFNPNTRGMNNRSYSPGGFSNSVNPNDPVAMGLLMGSLGFSGAGSSLGPDANAHLRPLVK